MNLYFPFVVIVLVCVTASSAESPSDLFSELFKNINDALIASGVGKTPDTRQQYQYPLNGISSSVYGALQTITRNDDLECVPRLLCEAVAGGNPAGTRQLNIDRFSLSRLISYLQLDTTNSSPMLAFGKAIVLGLSNRNDPYSCIYNYPKCPKDSDRLLYYLNNHRGGFFRFFDMKLPHQNYQYGQNGYYSQYQYNNYNRKPGNKPSNYYYSTRPNDYPYNGKLVKSGTYAKKFAHSELIFPAKGVTHSKKSKISFPEDGEARIQNQRVKKTSFIFKTENYRKTSKNFFPSDLNTVGDTGSFATDRLPSKFSGSKNFFPDN